MSFIGIRGLQFLGMELLTRREENEFEIKMKELENEKKRLQQEDVRLALEERKVRLQEDTLAHEVLCRTEERERFLQQVEKMLTEQEKRLSSLIEKKTL